MLNFKNPIFSKGTTPWKVNAWDYNIPFCPKSFCFIKSTLAHWSYSSFRYIPKMFFWFILIFPSFCSPFFCNPICHFLVLQKCQRLLIRKVLFSFLGDNGAFGQAAFCRAPPRSRQLAGLALVIQLRSSLCLGREGGCGCKSPGTADLTAPNDKLIHRIKYSFFHKLRK